MNRSLFIEAQNDRIYQKIMEELYLRNRCEIEGDLIPEIKASLEKIEGIEIKSTNLSVDQFTVCKVTTISLPDRMIYFSGIRNRDRKES